MIYCNYCQAAVQQLDRKATDAGWGRVKFDLTWTNHREGPESEETRQTCVLTHCPNHLQEAFNELVSRVQRACEWRMKINHIEGTPAFRRQQ